MEIDRAKAVAELLEQMRAAGVPDAEEIVEKIGDRYVDLLEEKIREVLFGTGTVEPRGILGTSPVRPWRSVLRGSDFITDEMRADAGLPART